MTSSSSKRKRQCPESDAHLDDGLHHEDASQEARAKKREKAQPPKEENVSLPPVSRYLPIVLGGSHWRGRRSLEDIVIFGGSYSKWNKGRTWVDHLQQHMQRQGYSCKTHNFAFPGATVDDNLWDQLFSFTRFTIKESNDKKPALDPDGTTYFIFMGINDCGNTECDELESIVEKIFDTLQHLYFKVGARNFVLIDIPPVDRSPQDSGVTEEIDERVKTWNDLLQEQITEFGLTNKDGTLLLFSLHQLLMDVLEDPLEYDFTEDDVTYEGGGIWADDLHLTSEVHDILGEQLLSALG